jgi:hypothetical protein
VYREIDDQRYLAASPEFCRGRALTQIANEDGVARFAGERLVEKRVRDARDEFARCVREGSARRHSDEPVHRRGSSERRAASGSTAARPGVLAGQYDFEYEFGMERVTATLDEETLAKIRHVAGPRGVSSFLNVAAREHLARLELRGLLDELDAKHGAASAAVRAEIARDARRIFRAR